MRFAYYVADAFTPTRFLGNAAGVVLDADLLTDDLMRSMASEIHLSETSFLLRPSTADADVRIRWFTPHVEVSMCGHATLAAAHILRQTRRWTGERPLRIETLSGILAVEAETTNEGDILWLTMPTPKLVPARLDPLKLAEACGVAFADILKTLPLMITQDRDAIVPVKDCQVLQAAQPHFHDLADLCRRNHLRGVCLTTRQAVSAAVNLQSRFFAPSVGIDEDPVTGSVHGPLGAYMILHHFVTLREGQAVAHCLQTPASGRVGLLRVYLRQFSGEALQVKVGGQCLTTMHGEVYID